jgi:type II secretory pathway pseudopilin PulG
MHGQAHKTTGLTLIEMTLVIGTMVLLVGLAVPAVRSLTHSFQSEGAVKSMIDAALSSARAMAMTRQRYVGVRFQKLCVSDDSANPLKGLVDAPQYMIFIMSDEREKMGGLASGFRAVDGLDPIKLPGTVQVLDPNGIARDTDIDELPELSNATTFSVVFGPSGRLVMHDVQVRNRNGVNRPTTGLVPATASPDDVFNVADTICRLRQGRFIQDDYPLGDTVQALGLGKEPSRTHFVIVESMPLRAAYEKKAAWTGYLSTLGAKTIYVSSYTGHLIPSD